MSKFCGNCGAQMDDNAMVCGYCGTAFENTKKDTFRPEDPEKKAKTQKIIKLASIAVAAIVVISIFFSILSSFTGYKGAVRKFMSAYKSENADALADMTCSVVLDYSSEDGIANKYEYKLENDFDSFDLHFDSKYSIKYEITNASKISERQVKNFMQQMDSYGWISEDDIDAVKKIMNVKITITAKHGSDSTNKYKTIYLAKEKGAWKLLDFE